jgi:hypothetical protein
MARRDAEVEEIEDPEVDEVEYEDEDNDSPAPKAKSVKTSEDEDQEEEVESEEEEAESKPVARKKVSRQREEEDQEESPKPKLVKKQKRGDEEESPRKKVAAVKKGGKNTMPKTEKKHRSPRRADWPYGDDSLVGKIFNKAESSETGIALKVARKMCEENKKAKTPSYWILTDIRRGSWKTAAGLWKWDVDPKLLEKGFLKVRNVRLAKLKAKAKAA